MPIGHPPALFGLIGALAGNLDAGHRIARVHDRADNVFDRVCQTGHAVSYRTSQMVFNRNAAYFGKALVDLQIAAVRRKNGQPYRRRIIDQLQRRLLGNRHTNDRR